MKTLVMIVALSLTFAVAAVAAENPKYKAFFLVGDKRVDIKSAESAILASVRGQEVYRCQTVEAKLSKSGTSIGIRNVKKKAE
jgi:hypothetical protein